MDISAVKEALSEQIDSISDQQFEQLCKIFVEEIENPTEIELTPFHGDGGIDVRGGFGGDLLSTDFGVQVKKFKDNIGSPAMRNFVGALQQHHYQTGLFITTSDFASGAIDLAEEQEDTPISLVSGEELLQLMIEEEIGVTKINEDSFEIDPEFWGIFDRTTSDNPLSTEEVPQANSFQVFQFSLMAIDQGYRHKPEIRDFISRKTGKDWTDRQADYYPQAGYALGYVHKDTIGNYRGRDMRRWGLTRDGQEYVELIQSGKKEEAEEHFRNNVEEMAIVQRILPIIKEEDSITHSHLQEIILQESELNESTSDRRASTVGRWIDKLHQISRETDGRSYKYVYNPYRIEDY